jgi:hypothetical protein
LIELNTCFHKKVEEKSTTSLGCVFRFAVFVKIKLPIFENLGYDQLGKFNKNKNFSC